MNYLSGKAERLSGNPIMLARQPARQQVRQQARRWPFQMRAVCIAGNDVDHALHAFLSNTNTAI